MTSKTAARAALVLGALAVLTVPGAVAAAQELSGVDLLKALYVGAPLAVVLGLLAFFASRRSRLVASRSVKPGSAGPLRSGRIVAWAGLYVGITSALALGVYGVLVWAQ
jgi:membrane protease YdiL (CAAX protease family)